jgi:hypothetical protein
MPVVDPTDYGVRPDNVFERDDQMCQNCKQSTDEHPSVELTGYRLPPFDDSTGDAADRIITICSDCAELTTPFTTPEERSVDVIVDHLTELLERYEFAQTSVHFMELSEEASYIIPEIADDGGDRVKRYKQRQRLLRFKFEAARNLADEFESVTKQNMPETFKEEYLEYIETWRHWVDEAESILENYNLLIEVDETDYSVYVHPDKDVLTNELLQRKREWGAVNEDYRDIIAEFFDLQHTKWEACPNCNHKECVWFKNELAECSQCHARWEKSGWLRKRWEMTRGSHEGQRKTLDGWREQVNA